MPKKERAFEVQVPLYGLEAVYLTCYSYLDRAYIRLEGDPAAAIRVVVKEKADAKPGGLDKLEGEFFGELLHQALRVRISNSNQKIREYIVARALASAEGVKTTAAPGTSGGKEANAGEAVLDEQLEAEIEKLLAEVEKGAEGDPLKIAVPWEEKHGQSGTSPEPASAGEPKETKEAKNAPRL